MRRAITLFIILSIVACVFALDKPTNYYAGAAAAGGVRGVQQQAESFAVWNTSSNNWVQVLPPRVSGTVNGIVAVGDGLLAYGSFTAFGGPSTTSPAAGLLYYNGQVWAAPEGVGLYTLTLNSSYSFYDNVPTGTGTGIAATVDSNNVVYLYGTFDQVGLVRDGVNGFVALQWSAGGVFTINKIGNGYYKLYSTPTNGAPNCVICAGSNPPVPASGLLNKMKMYRSSTSQNLVFTFLADIGQNLYQWEVNTGLWVAVTGQTTNGALNITAINDYDIASGTNNIFVVGFFQRLTDPNTNLRYQHIAVSTDNGVSFSAFGSALNQTLFGDLPAVLDQNGVTIQPAVTNTIGFTAISAQSATSVWVAGAIRDGFRQTGQTSGVPSELTLKVFQITSTAGVVLTSLSERFGPYSGLTANAVTLPSINQMAIVNGNLYVFGTFTYYRQLANPNIRFTSRFTNGYKGAAVMNVASLQWSPAFGGFLTTTQTSDASPVFPNIYCVANQVSGSFLIYFAGRSSTIFRSTWGALSGSMFAYGGDQVNNAKDRWNVVFGNNRVVTQSGSPSPSIGSNSGTGGAFSFPAQPIGNDGSVNAILIVAQNDAIIFGGQFDYIGSNLVPGVGFYNPDLNLIGSVGGGLFIYNNQQFFQADNVQNNRIGGIVRDLAEYNGNVYAAGLFNRNNTGSPLANIASIAFRTGGAGWLQVDGGCDNEIRDILIRDGKLYATGSFVYCGLNPEGFKEGNGLFRGRVPTSGIAVIDLDSDVSVRSWRPLGIGLQGATGNTNGVALAYRRGFLYVSGAFTSAGGVLYTNGIAKWDGNAWSDVLGVCQDACNRPTNNIPVIGVNVVPNPAVNERKPTTCTALSTLQGNVYCIDSGRGSGILLYYDGTYWRQTGTLTVVATTTGQNSVIVNNGSNPNSILVTPTTTTIDANSANLYNWNTANQNYEPSFTGFSVRANALASGSIVVVSQLLAICLLIVFMFLF